MESITAKGILYGEKRTVTIEKEESGLKLSVEESVSSEILEAIKVRFKLCQESANHIFGLLSLI